MFASLVALDDFRLLLFTLLIADLTLEWSGGSRFHPLSHICSKTLFATLKQLQRPLWIIEALSFFIDCEQTRQTLWTQLSHWQIFMKNCEHTTFWNIQILCYLCYKWVCGFSSFPRNCRIWMTLVFSLIWVCTTAFKVSIAPLNHYVHSSGFRITLIKPFFIIPLMLLIKRSSSPSKISYLPLFDTFPNTKFKPLGEIWILK